MANSEAKARRWVDLLVNEPAVPFAARLRSHFDAGLITRLCDCGCTSFDLQIPEGVSLEPLVLPGGDGLCFELNYESETCREIAFLFFVDRRGYLSGIDVTCGDANHAPMPEDPRLGRLLYAGP